MAKSYEVFVKLTLDFGVFVEADSYDAAAAKINRDLVMSKVQHKKADYNDIELEVYGVYNNDRA